MEVVIGAIVALGGLVYSVWRYTDDAARTRRVLRRARVVPIAELVDGQLACIVGTVEADITPISAMMTGVPCVAFDTITQEYTSDVSTRATTTRHAVPFFVVDKTGRARIDAPQVALCNKPAARTDRYVERVLVVGAKVRLVGSVSLDPTRATHSEHAYRANQFTASLSGTAKYPLLADSDD